MTTSLAERALDDNGLADIANEVWRAYLDTDGTHPLVRVDESGAVSVTASISVTGAWDGHVVIGCSQRAAVALAAAMLDLPPSEVTESDVLDAAGELVNVVGGNVKSLVNHETFRPELKKLPMRYRKFRANRSMRDVEPSVNLWVKTLDNIDVEEDD